MNAISHFITGVILLIIGIALGAVVFSGVYLTAWLYRKFVFRIKLGVYKNVKPGLFSLCFGIVLALMPFAVTSQQTLIKMGIEIEYVPTFFRAWFWLILGFVIVLPIVLIRDFMKPASKSDAE